MSSFSERYNKVMGGNSSGSGAEVIPAGGRSSSVQNNGTSFTQRYNAAMAQYGDKLNTQRDKAEQSKDFESVNKYISSIPAASKRYRSQYTSATKKWTDADTINSRLAEIEQAQKNNEAARKYYSDNRGLYSDYDDIMSSLDDLDKLYKQLSTGYSDMRFEYGKYSEDEYNKMLADADRWKKYGGLNAEQTQAEIERLQGYGMSNAEISQRDAELQRQVQIAEQNWQVAQSSPDYMRPEDIAKAQADYENAVAKYEEFQNTITPKKSPYANATAINERENPYTDDIAWLQDYLPSANYYSGVKAYGYDLNEYKPYEVLDKLDKITNPEERGWAERYIGDYITDNGMIGRENYDAVAEAQRQFDTMPVQQKNAIYAAAQQYNRIGDYGDSGYDVYSQALDEAAEKTGMSRGEVDAQVRAIAPYASQQDFEEYSRWISDNALNGTLGGFGSTLMTYAVNPVANIEANSYILLSRIAGEHPEAGNSAMRGYEFVTGTRSAVAQNLEKLTDAKIFGTNAASWLYQAINSTVDSAINMAITQGTLGLAGLAPAAVETTVGRKALSWALQNSVSNAIMGSGASVQKFIDAKQQGLDDKQALISSITAGAIEGITEAIGGDRLANFIINGDTTWKTLAKSFLAEGTEEVAANIGNRILDALVTDDESQAVVIAKIRNLLTGYLAAGFDSKEALNKAFTEALTEDLSAFVAGGLSGALMGGAGNLQYHANEMISDARSGRQMIKNGGRAQAISQVNATINDVNAMMDIGRQSAISDKASARKIGQAMRVANENRSYVNTREAMSVASPIIRQSLENNGIVSEHLNTATSALTKYYTASVLKGEVSSEREAKLLELTDGEKKMLDVPAIKETYKNLIFSQNGSDLVGATSSVLARKTAKSDAGKMHEGQDAATFAKDKATVATAAANFGDTEVGRRYAIKNKGSLTEEQALAIYNDFAENENSGKVEDGKLVLPKSLSIKGTVSVRAAWNKISDPDLREEFAYSGTRAYNVGRTYYGTTYGTDYINELAEAHPDIASELRAQYEAGGKESSKEATAVSSTYRGGRARLANADNLQRYAGHRINAVDMRGMKEADRKATQKALDFHSYLGRALGVNFVLFDSKRGNVQTSNANGFFDADTNTIFLDIRAAENTGGSMLFTTAHELTHFIASNAKAEFRVLQDFVVDQYYDGDASRFEAAVGTELKQFDKSYPNREQKAVEEIVAQACEDMLQDSNAIAELAQRDEQTYNKIGSWLRKWVKKFDAAVKQLIGSNASNSEYAKAMRQSADRMKQMQKLWDNALVAAALSGRSVEDNGNIRKSNKRNMSRFEYAKTFAEQISDYIAYNRSNLRDDNSGLPVHEDDSFLLGGTPDVLRRIGLLSLPLTINKKHVDYVLYGNYRGSDERVNDHIFSYEDFASLPEKIANPVAVIEDRQLWQKKASEYRVDVIVEMNVNGKDVLVPIAINARGHVNGVEIDSNNITTAHGDTNTLVRLANAVAGDRDDDVRVYYVNKEKTTKYLRPTGNPISSAAKIPDGFIHSINDKGSPVKMRFDNITKTQQFKRWFGDWERHADNASKIVNNDGTPRVVYHQTASEFYTFSNDNPVAGANDSETPNGYFFKDNDHDIGLEGSRQMAVYLNIRNPLHFANREDANRWYQKNVIGYEDLQNEMQGKIDPIDAEMNRIEDAMFAEGVTDDRYDELDVEWNARLGDLKKIEDDYRGRLRDLLNQHFLNGNSGYDGIILDYDGHRYVDGVREDVKSYIVFNNTQIKSATENIGLFDSSNPDIRYSVKRNTTGMTEDQITNANKIISRLRQDALGSKYLTDMVGLSDSRLNYVIRDSVRSGSIDAAKSYIAWVDPVDFIFATTSSTESRANIEQEAGELDMSRLQAETQPIYLRVNMSTGEIIGHEGRHRMTALNNADVRKVAVVITADDVISDAQPVQSMKLKGQRYTDYRKGTDFYVHNMLPISSRYAEDVQELFGKASVRYSQKRGQQQFTAANATNNASEIDRLYMDAVNSGDMEAAQRMVNERAEYLRAETFAQTDVPTYRIRRGATPKKTIKVYKTFTLSENGNPSALFVSSQYDIPVGVWLDAQDTFHFTDQKNGHMYVPSTKNPNTKGGATGRMTALANISDDELAELEKRGYIKRGKDGKYTARNITSLAYRPGWHAGDLPFFPQGGMKIEGSNYENVHRYNQVVFECEMAADVDYTTYTVNDDGGITYKDRQEMPVNGSYKFATNPMANAQDIGAWYISGALKIVRALSQEECDQILADNGRLPQEWQAYQNDADLKAARRAGNEYEYEHTMGPLDLDALGYDPNRVDGGRKLLDAVTYDDNGNVIPLSQRFNKEISDPRFSQKRNIQPAGTMSDERYQQIIDKQKALIADLRAEFKPGDGTLDRSKVRKVARQIRLDWGSTVKVDELTDALEDAYTYLSSGDNAGFDNALEDAIDLIADNILIDAYPEADQIAKLIKRPMSIDETQRGEIIYAYGSVAEFQKRTGLRINNKSGLPMDIAYKEIASPEMYGYLLDENASSADQPRILAELLDTVTKKHKDNYYSTDEIRDLMALDIAEAYSDSLIYRTYSDRMNQRIKDLKAEHRETVRTIRNEYKQQLAEAEKQIKGLTGSAAKLADVHAKWLVRQEKINARYEDRIARAREREASALLEGRRRLAEYRQQRDESDAVKTFRARVESDVKTMQDMLISNSDKLHIPEPLKTPIGEFLQSINLDSKQLTNTGVQTQRDIRYAERANELSIALSRYISSDGRYSDGYIDLLPEHIELLNQSVDAVKKAIANGTSDGSVYMMDAAQLQNLSRVLTIIRQSVSSINQFMANRRLAVVSEAAYKTMDDVDSLGEARALAGFLGKAQTLASTLLLWDNATPYSVFKRFGETGEAMFGGIADGWAKLAKNAKQAIDFANSTYTEQQSKDWEKEILTINLSDKNGKQRSVQMTVAQAMSFYCLAKRQQALGHIYGGGIRVTDITDGRRVIRQSDPYTLDVTDIREIINALTDEQRAVADKLQNYMNTVGSQWGNEVSMARFGYRAFGELNYFPIESEKSNLQGVNPEAKENDMFRLLNLSATKGLIKGANNAIVVDSIFNVFSSHMADMAKYNALALPVLDLVKWYNYVDKTTNSDGSVETKSLRRSLDKAFGRKVVGDGKEGAGYATSYLTNFIKDLNGANNGGRAVTGLNALMGRYKKAAVAANLRVAVQQPMSIMRASAVIDPKWIAYGTAHIREGIDDMLQHGGMAIWKDLGFYDVNIGRDIEEQIAHRETAVDKIGDKTMILAELGDKVTWGALWSAAKAEQSDKGYTGAELTQATEERFNEIVFATQVVDSTITRSDLMRNSSQLAKIYTSFMSEPTLSWNLLMNAALDIHYARRRGESTRGSVGKLVRAGAAYTANALALAVVTALIDAWRDDDSYDTFWAKFSDKLPENTLDELNFVDNIAVVGKAIDAFKSEYGSNSSIDVAWISDAKQAVSNIGTLYKLATDPNATTTKTGYGMVFSILRAASDLTGLPIGSASREFASLWNNTVGALYESARLKTSNESPALRGYPNLVDAYMDGDEDRQFDLLSDMHANGLSDDTINKGVKNELKKRYTAGEIDRDTAADFLVSYCGYDPLGVGDDSTAYLLDKWDNGSASTTWALKEAFASGNEDDVEEAIDYLRTNYRSSDSSLKSATTSYWKELYKAADDAERRRIRGLILATGLYTAAELDKVLEKWLKSE